MLRVIPLGEVNQIVLHNLVHSLNSIQDRFIFEMDPQIIPLPEQNQLNAYDEDDLKHYGSEIAKSRHLDEFPVLICNVCIGDDLESSFDSQSALVSTYGWEYKFPGIEFDRILAFHLTDILLGHKSVFLPVHYESQICPSDYCENPSDRIPGILRAAFCSSCRSELRRAINHGSLSVADVAAVYRILDWIAGRRYAFVAMPFGGEFDDLYRDVIKPAAENGGWLTVRVDEVLEATSIPELIWEEIHRCRVVIADISGNNPNVFYEVGFAHALARPTILMTRDLSKVPFDLRHRQVVLYTPSTSKHEIIQRLSHYLYKD